MPTVARPTRLIRAARAASRRGVLRTAATAAGVALIAAGCIAPVSLDAPPVSELPPPVPDWIATRVTEADDGRRIALAVGGSFAVSLRVPLGAGIGWTVLERPAGLAMTGRTSGPVWPPGAPASPAVPPPLWQVFVFEARTPVDGPLILELGGTEAGARPRRLVLRVAPAAGG